MSILDIVSYNCHRGGGGLPLSKIKSHLKPEQLVPEQQASPDLKIDKYISEICSFRWWRLDNLF